ncbi:hypothetical protein [Streptomyces sp. WAC 01325]|uniref:hypothetical protein n=1 Tax=Streptomyces sp. WAC 01325 TaxID=2203202 RepID=UPI00163CCCF5|nr:hypothetical protein [Streptomyces sp. WAC 01325]
MADRWLRRQAAAGVEPVRAALVASLAVQKAIRAARTPPAAARERPAATASAAAHAEDHHRQTVLTLAQMQ